MLGVIRGKTIKEIATVNEYLSILFDDGDTGLHIFNNYSTGAQKLTDLVGKSIENVSEADDYVSITFNDGINLQIGMRDCDYNGPESLIYFTSSGVYVDQYDSARRHQFRP